MTSFVDVLGTVATLSAYAVEYGMARQAMSNYRKGSCENLEPQLFVLVTIGYSCWSAYGFVKHDWYLFFSNIPGVVVSVIVCWQIWRYRPKVKTSP